MRAAFYIFVANLVALALGGVVTLWLIAAPPAAAPAAATSLLSAAVPSALAAAPPPPPPPTPPTAVEAVAAPAPTPAPAQPAPAGAPPIFNAPGSAPAPAPAAAAAEAPEPVTAPATPPAPAPRAAAIAPGGRYVLRLGSFLRPDNAASLRAALRRHGFAAEIVTASVAGKSWREVQIGGFQDRASVAAAEARVLRELGIAGGLVLKTGWQ